MVSSMNQFGYLYKEMRKARGITLKEATGGEFSQSMLSRFENGENELSANKLFRCLDNIYLDVEEFNLLVREFEPSDFNRLQRQIHRLFNPFNEIGLEKLAIEELEKIKTDNREKFHTLNHIFIKSRIKSVNNQYDISDDLVIYLKNYLFSMEHWANYELILFSETIHLFELDAFIYYYKEMLNRSDFYKKLPYNTNLIQTILINGIFYCVENEMLDEASTLISIMKDEFSHTRDAYMKIVFMISEGAYVTKFNKIEGVAKIKEGIHIFRTLSYDDIADYYESEFKDLLD